jgi:hypothetical protein
LTWDLLHRGDTFQTPIPVFCQPTADFASVDLASPERRSSHAWVSACDHALTFGGKTDCGAIDDVWAFDYASGTWENPVPATLGEVCLRYQNGDPTFCAGLCQ